MGEEVEMSLHFFSHGLKGTRKGMPKYSVTRYYTLAYTIEEVEAKNEEEAFDEANDQFGDIAYDDYQIVKSDTYVNEIEEEA